MKKILLIISALAAALMLLDGCDFMRAAAGRPTSADIQARRELIAREDSILQARRDSVLRVEAAAKRAADSLLLRDSLKTYGYAIYGPSRMGGLAEGSYDWQFSVVVGAFASELNAQNYVKRMEELGFSSSIIPFPRALKIVGVGRTNDIFEFNNTLVKLKEAGYSGMQAWILLNE